MSKKLILLLMVSLAVRLIGLNQSLWLDEATSVQVAKNYSYSEIPSKFSTGDFHPPLYYIILKAWIGVFGSSVTSLRLPSIIFSLVTIFIIYRLAGFGAAALVGLNPLLVYYSQEARMYSLVTMLLMGALYAWNKKKYWIYWLLTGLSVWSFYGSILFGATFCLYFLVIKRDGKLFFKAAAGWLGAFLIVSPLLWAQWQNSKQMLLEVKNWSLVLGKANLKDFILILVKSTSGRIAWYPKVFYYGVAGVWAAMVWAVVIFKARQEKFYGFLLGGTLVLGILVSFFAPMLQYFRFLYLIPLMALIIKDNKIIIGGFLIFSLWYVLTPSFYREDWQSLTSNLGNKVYMIGSFKDPVNYYRPDIEVADMRSEIIGNNIEVVPYGEEIHGVDHEEILKKAGYKLDKTINYREISEENWSLVDTKQTSLPAKTK